MMRGTAGSAVLAALGAGDKLEGRTWQRLRDRLWRRDLWFVTRLGQVTDELGDVTAKLENLWGPHYAHGAFPQRLTELQPLKAL